MNSDNNKDDNYGDDESEVVIVTCSALPQKYINTAKLENNIRRKLNQDYGINIEGQNIPPIPSTIYLW